MPCPMPWWAACRFQKHLEVLQDIEKRQSLERDADSSWVGVEFSLKVRVPGPSQIERPELLLALDSIHDATSVACDLCQWCPVAE